MKIYSSFSPFKNRLLSGDIKDFSLIAAKLKDGGFDGIEINSVIFDLYNQKVVPFGFNFSSIDYSMVSLHSNYLDFNLASVDSRIRKACIDQVVSEYEFARKKRIPTVTIHPGKVRGISRENAMELFWDSLSKIFNKINTSETKLCLENMDNKKEKLCNNSIEIEETLKFFPELSLTVDFAHLGLNNEDISLFLDKFEARIRHIHISGVRGNLRHAEVSLPESEIDFNQFLSRYKKKDIIAVIENCFWEDATKSKKMLEKIV